MTHLNQCEQDAYITELQDERNDLLLKNGELGTQLAEALTELIKWKNDAQSGDILIQALQSKLSRYEQGVEVEARVVGNGLDVTRTADNLNGLKNMIGQRVRVLVMEAKDEI